MSRYNKYGDGALTVSHGKSALFRFSGGQFTAGLGEKGTLAAPAIIKGYLPGDTSLVFFTEWSGGVHCCSTVYPFLVSSEETRFLGPISAPAEGFEFKDLDGDGKAEIIAWITPLNCAFTPCADDPAYPLPLKWREGWKTFVPAPELLYKELPETKNVEALAKGWAAKLKSNQEENYSAKREFLKLLCDWTAAGHMDQAMKLADLALKGVHGLGDGRV